MAEQRMALNYRVPDQQLLEWSQRVVEKMSDRLPQLFFGGRSDNQHNWEGRLDEVAIFDRALTEEEVQSLAGKK